MREKARERVYKKRAEIKEAEWNMLEQEATRLGGIAGNTSGDIAAKQTTMVDIQTRLTQGGLSDRDKNDLEHSKEKLEKELETLNTKHEKESQDAMDKVKERDDMREEHGKDVNERNDRESKANEELRKRLVE